MGTVHQNESAAFPGLIDLASQRLGGKALLASDEFFAPKENLLKPGRGVFIPDKYTDRGKWMDGWETRRRRPPARQTRSITRQNGFVGLVSHGRADVACLPDRQGLAGRAGTPGHDWCIIKLGLPGVIKKIDIDTNYFLGNHPPYASVDACTASTEASGKTLTAKNVDWAEILPESPLNPGSQNFFDVRDEHRWTHVRLNIFPDGGVARLRMYGVVVPDWRRFKRDELIDLACIKNGGVALVCSDMFFSSMNNLILPGRAKTMGEGWETKRRRGPGYDWIIIKLGTAGMIKKIEVDTNHFKGNYPDRCSIDGCYFPGATVDLLPQNILALTGSDAKWMEILPQMKLQGHKRHIFEKELHDVGPCTHVRLNIYPDGGVSRLRVFGTIDSRSSQ